MKQSFSRPNVNPTSSGKRLRLRDGLYKQLDDREWIFNRLEDNSIFLVHKSGTYGVVVRPEDIDWKAQFETEEER
jgi:hypothetical protein